MPRKASTQPKSVEIDRPRAPLALAVIVVLAIGATAGAIAWGRSDTGAINVSATIAASQPQNEDEARAPVGIATNEHSALPNGGLEPQGGETPLAPAPEPVVEVTSSSTATTSETGVDESSEMSGDSGDAEEANAPAEATPEAEAEVEASDPAPTADPVL